MIRCGWNPIRETKAAYSNGCGLWMVHKSLKFGRKCLFTSNWCGNNILSPENKQKEREIQFRGTIFQAFYARFLTMWTGGYQWPKCAISCKKTRRKWNHPLLIQISKQAIVRFCSKTWKLRFEKKRHQHQDNRQNNKKLYLQKLLRIFRICFHSFNSWVKWN